MKSRVASALFATGLALCAGPALARPYLLLQADDQGFTALDLGGMDRASSGQVEVTLIEAPLAGAPVGERLAPLIERRVQVSCLDDRWRWMSAAYVDGQEKVMAKDDADQVWQAFGDDVNAPAVQKAACQRVWRRQSVSRYLNLGEILANYQAAHARAKPEPPAQKELLDRIYRNSH